VISLRNIWFNCGEKIEKQVYLTMMREVFIISTGEILNGKTAGSRRMLNIARSLAAGRITVYLCSFPEFKGEPANMNEVQSGIYTLESVNKAVKRGGTLRRFMRTIDYYAKRSDAEKVIYLYPTTYVLKDFMYLLYFKYIKSYRFFCEINELRSAIAFSSPPPLKSGPRIKYYLKSVKEYIVFTLNEYQVILYDGIVVISTSLERYFSRYTARIIRVPILCNTEEIAVAGEPPVFNGETFKICFAGYIKSEKEGFALLYEALSIVSDEKKVELYLYGILDEEDNVRLRQLADKYELTEHVFYLGNLEPERLKYEFLKYHLLILPRPLNKRTKYGFSTKLSEYLVSGVPVLLTDVSDNALYIRDNYNGYLISPGSAPAIAEKLIYIINHYNSQAKNIVDNAYLTVRKDLDLRLFTDQFAEFFFDVKGKLNLSARTE